MIIFLEKCSPNGFSSNTVMNVYGYQSRIYLPVLKLYQKVD